MAREVDVYCCQFRFLGRVFSLRSGYGDAKKAVIKRAQQLTVLVERFLSVFDAEVYECLAIAGEVYRLSFDRAVWIEADIVAVVYLLCLFQAQRFHVFSYNSDEALPDGVHVLDVVSFKCLFLWYVKTQFPAVVEDEPVIGGLFVDERSLPVRCVVTEILE